MIFVTGNFDRKFLYEDYVCTDHGYFVCPYDRNLPLYLSCTNYSVRNDEQTESGDGSEQIISRGLFALAFQAFSD